MRKQVEHRLRRPPGLVVVEGVFGKAARVDDSVLRTDVGPLVGRGLPAIVEPGPHESPGKPWPRVAEPPPAFGGCASGRGVRVIRTHEALASICDVNAASADRADRFGAHHRFVGILFVKLLRARVHVVIAGHVPNSEPTGSDRAGWSDGHRTRAIVLLRDGFHSSQDQSTPGRVRLAFSFPMEYMNTLG